MPTNEQWLSSFDWDSRPFLGLPNSAMERICRFLPTQKALYTACLIHPRWLKAATDVLWEAPELRDPESFRLFAESVKNHKKSALVVKRLSLCLRDEEHQTVFRPIMDSELERHSYNHVRILTRSFLIHNMAQQCEKIRSYKIYGWGLEPMMLGTLDTILTDLESLTLVGSNPSFQGVFIQRSLLSKLKELRLDGRFPISPQFAKVISERALALESLQVSLAGMERVSLISLCSGKLDLRKLILTQATHLTEADVQGVLDSFPNLTELTLHGTTWISANTIVSVVTSCPSLCKLEIRADPASLKIPITATRMTQDLDIEPLNLKQLLIENLNVPEDIINALASRCPSLTTLGLKNCHSINDDSLVPLVERANRLTTLHLIACPDITESILHHLCKGPSRNTINHIHIEQCGNISPRAIYQLCCQCSKHLRHVRLVGYRNIAKSPIKDFAIERPGNISNVRNDAAIVITLDESNIDAMVNTDMSSEPELMSLPESRYLSGAHIVSLARILNMDVSTLENALDRAQNEDQPWNQDIGFANDVNGYPSGNEGISKRSSRVAALKASSGVGGGGGGQRPTTPGLWATANEAAITQHIPGSIRQQHAIQQPSSNAPYTERMKPLSPVHSESPAQQEEESAFEFEEQEYSNDDSYEEEDEEDEDEERYDNDEEEEEVYQVHMRPEDVQRNNKSMYQVPDEVTPQPQQPQPQPLTTQLPPMMNEWPSLSASNRKKQQEVDLGGWGSTTTVPWAQKASGQVQDQQEQSWKPHTLEQYENTWQQKALETTITQASRRRPVAGKVKTMENDGWGTPKNYVAWDDLRVQGYAHDVLERQKSNVYWEKSSNGEWRVLNPKAPPQERPAAMPSPRLQSSHAERSTPAPLSAAEWPTIQKAASQSPHQRQQQSPSQQLQQPPPSTKKPFPPELCSDDEEVIDWDEDDGVTINTSPQFASRTLPSKAPPTKPANVQNRPKSPRPTPSHTRTNNRRVDTPPTTYAGRWNEPIDFDQPLRPNEQQQSPQQRVTQPSSTSTPEFDFLIDTSDTVKKTVEDPTIYKSPRQPAGMELSSIWQDMSDLNAPSSTTATESHHQQQQAPESSDSHSETDGGGDGILQPTRTIVDNNSLLDTSEDLMSTTSTLSQRLPDSTTGTMTPLVPERISTSQSKGREEPSKQTTPTPSPSPPSPSPPQQPQPMQSDAVQKDEKDEEKKESGSSSPSPKSIVYRVNLSLGGSQEQSVLTVYENQALRDAITEYCIEHNVDLCHVDILAEKLQQGYRNAVTRRILKKGVRNESKKKKKKRQQQTGSPTTDDTTVNDASSSPLSNNSPTNIPNNELL